VVGPQNHQSEFLHNSRQWIWCNCHITVKDLLGNFYELLQRDLCRHSTKSE